MHVVPTSKVTTQSLSVLFPRSRWHIAAERRPVRPPVRTVDAAPVPSRIVSSTTSESRLYSLSAGNRNSSQTAWRARLGATENSPLVRTAPRHMLGLTPSPLTNGSAAERHFMARLLEHSPLKIVPHRVGRTHRLVDQGRGGAASRYSNSVPAGQARESRRAEPGSPPGQATRQRRLLGRA